jgi:hypothetical protein
MYNMRYKIIYNGDAEFITSLELLSREVVCNCQIIELTLSFDKKGKEILPRKEVYLGRLSEKSLAYIAIEIASYAFESFKTTCDVTQQAVQLFRKFIQDPDSVSSADDLCVGIPYNEYHVEYNCALRSVESLGYMLYELRKGYMLYELRKRAEPFKAFKVEGFFCDVIKRASLASESKNKEYIRQGNFIVDFLKSDKSLFMV